MRVSQLRLPDPLEGRDLDMEEYHTQMKSGLSQLADGKSECGLSDIDCMSLPSSTGLSQLSVLGDVFDDDSQSAAGEAPKGRLEMSVASTRSSLAPAADSSLETRDAPNDTLSDTGGGYSIISHIHGCPSPSYSITGVSTPPPPPVRSSLLLRGTQLNPEASHASLPRNLKDYVNGMSTANERGLDEDEHQRNFEMWLKSVTPYSQRTCGSDAISPMSSLASPVAKHTAHSLKAPAGPAYNYKPTAQSLYERYARLRQSSTLPTSGQTTALNEDNPSHGLHSMLTLHSSDVSVPVPAVTDSPGSIKTRSKQPAESSLSSSPLSNSYTAALETIEQLCETADESDSVINEDPSSSSADQSFKTAFTTFDTASSARLAISREYDAGDELASFESSSGDSAWETEDSSESEETSDTSTRTKRKNATTSRKRATLFSLIRSLSSASRPQGISKGSSSSNWSRLCLGSLIVLLAAILIGKYHTSVSSPLHNNIITADVHKRPEQALAATAVVQMASISDTPTLSRIKPVITASHTSRAARQTSINDPLARHSKINRPPSAHTRMHPLFSVPVKNDALEYIFVLAISFATAYCLKIILKRVRTALKPGPAQSSLRYVPGRKIVIRPSRKSAEALVRSDTSEQQKGCSRENPIDLVQDDTEEDLASSCSSVVTVVPSPAKVVVTEKISGVNEQREEKQIRSASTPAKASSKDTSTPRCARATTLSPPGSDRVLRSHTRLQHAKADHATRSSAPTTHVPASSAKEKLKQNSSSPLMESKSKPTTSTVRAKIVPVPSRSAVDEQADIPSKAYKKAANVPARNRKHETFHVCLIHGSSGVGKASLLQRAKRGTFFDPEHPSFPGPESLEEFKNLKDVKHLHFEKRDTLTTLVFGYGRMLENPDSSEAKAWKEINKIYTLPNAEKSKFDKRGNNVHVFVYTVNDKLSQREAVRMAARALSDEPHSQIAMVLAKCDLTRSERTLETTQAQVHAALRQALGAEHSMERITYYRTSAKTQGGVDDLFRDIARKLRREASEALQRSDTLPMQLD